MASGKRKNNGLRDFKKDIREDKIKNIYIFHGDEKYLVEHYIEQLKSKLINPDMEQFNYTEFDDSKLKLEQIMDAVESLPVFSERKLVVVRDFDVFYLDKSSMEDLEAMISDMPETTCLVFVYNVLEYRQKATTKLYKTITKRGRIVEFPVQSESELISWLKRHFRAQNKEIDNSTASYMLYICGKLMYKLKLEVDKVAAYANGNKVTRSDIDAVCAPVLDAVIYKMTDAVAEQRYSDALQIMRELIQMKNDPTPILAALGKQLRRLYYTKKAMEFGDPTGFLKNELDIRYQFLINKTIGNARNLTTEWCVGALELCAEYDYKMKRTGWDREVLLELLILNLSHLRELENKTVNSVR